MDKTVLFWILFGLLGFAFALAVQMRVMVALVLRRALKAWRPVFEDRVKANQVVILAAGADPWPDETESDLVAGAQHLRDTYPLPLGHLHKARRYSVIAPVLLVILLALGRVVWGVV